MKSLRDYALNISEEEYHALPAWSYSVIAKYARDGFGALPTLTSPLTPSAAMEFGSFFDTLMTRGEKAVFEQYAVSDVVAPDAEKKVFDVLLGKGNKNPFDKLADEEIKQAIEEAGYQKRWGYDAQYKHLSDCAEYYNIRRTGKKIFSSQDWNDATAMRLAMMDNEFIGNLFGQGDDYLYQLQFQKSIPFITRQGIKKIEIKAMFDLIKIDHERKTIQPVDLKTSSFAGHEFYNSFVKMRYDLQASLYTYLLKEIIEDTEYRDYRVLPFIFVCISRTDKVPVAYFYDADDTLSIGEYTYKNWNQLLTEIIDYRDEEAKVPNYIKTDSANDIRKLLEYKWQKDSLS